MKKQLAAAMFLIATALALISCGGGGGGGSEPPTSFTPIGVAALSGTEYRDLLNLQPGNTVQLALVGTDSTGNLVNKTVTGWTTTAPAGVATTTTSGTLTAGSASTTIYTVQVTYSGVKYTANIRVKNAVTGATLTGDVLSTSGKAVGLMEIVFFDKDLIEVGRTVVKPDGTFSTVVPSTGKTFAVKTTAIKGYYDQFSYNGTEYSLSVVGCYAALPTLTNGATVTLPKDILVRPKTSSSPPPPPVGCLP